MRVLLFLISILFGFVSLDTKAQIQEEELNIRFEIFVKGNLNVIGNQILNRKTKDASPNTPYNEVGENAKNNEILNMFYVDIDNNINTFSSSSAYLTFKDCEDCEVIYAGLYWAATYPYNEGEFKKKKYRIIDNEREKFNHILLKTPNNDTYQPVEGKVLFDGKNSPDFEGISPYVCYADVTEIINIHNPNGEYTVANVRAAQGNILGGSSAGWILVVINENPKESIKRIVTYDGLTAIDKNDKKLIFKGFVTPKENEFSTRLFGAAIEGDFNTTGDKVSIYTPKKGREEQFLSSIFRSEDNFFNSSITVDATTFNNRNPASKNTLGFDVFNIQIKNPNTQIIPNNSKEINLIFKNNPDKYFLFFLALEIDNKVMNEIDVFGERPLKIYKIKSKEIEEGYYNIIGTFLNEGNAKRQVEKHKELNVNYFRDEKLKLYFVHANKSLNLEEAKDKGIALREKHPEHEETWILYVAK